MSKLKKFLCILAAILLTTKVTPMLVLAAPGSNATTQTISLRWANIASAEAGISASGTTVKPSVAVTATNSSYKISGTLYLEKQSGSSWINVTSWPVSGTGTLRMSKSYTGTTGITYRSSTM